MCVSKFCKTGFFKHPVYLLVSRNFKLQDAIRVYSSFLVRIISYRDSTRLRRTVSAAAAPERDLIKSVFMDQCVPMF